MTDVTLKDVGTGYDLKTTINENNDTLEEALHKTLNKDGGDSNAMQTDIDMSGIHRVGNAANAVNNQDYVTLSQAASIATATDTALTADNVGAVLYPRTAAEAGASIAAGTSIGTVWKLQYPPGDVRRYGAVAGAGYTNHLAFQAALDQNNDDDVSAAMVTSPPGDFRIDVGLTWCGTDSGTTNVDNRHWVGEGTVLSTSVTSIDVLTIGPVTGSGEAMRLKFTGVHFSFTPADATHGSTKSALVLGQIYSSYIEVGAQWFYTGLKLAPTGTSGCVYNEIHLGTMMNNFYGVWLAPSSDGWANENTFHGGRFGGGRTPIGSHIYMPYSGSDHGQPNNNRFMGPSLEGGTSSSGEQCANLYYDDGYYNLLFWPRVEHNYDTITGEAEIELGPESSLGGIFGGRSVKIVEGSSGNNTIIDRGDRNTVYAMDGIHGTQSRSGGGGAMVRWFRDRAATLEPMCHMGDFYSGSGDGQAYLSTIARSTDADSYHFKGQTPGAVRANTDGMFYHCRVAHTSEAQWEPGKGANWRDKWEVLNSQYLGNFTWDYASTSAIPFRKWTIGQDYSYASADGTQLEVALGFRITHNGLCYKAIADPAGNNSGVAAAATEPGVGASAGTYWAVDADVSWVTGTDYAAPTTDIELHGDGILMFGDADDKSTAGASGTITVRTSDAVEVPGSLSATEGSLFLSKNGRAYLHPTSSNSDWRPLMTNWDYDSGEGTSGDIDLVVGDEKTIFNIGDASADRSINVPTNAAQAFAVGTEIKFFAYWQAADGPYDVAFVAASGVTIRGDLVHDVSSDQSGWTFLLTKVGTDTWILERYKTSHTTSSGD